MSAETHQAAWSRRHATLPPLLAIGDGGLGEAFNRWMYRVRGAVFLSAMSPQMTQLGRCRVLDVGSGTGFYVDRWLALGAGSVTASDFAPAAVDALRRRLGAGAVRHLDIADPEIAVAGRGYDAVSAMDVLFHITDDPAYRQAIANLGRLVRPGGLLVISENFRPDRTHRVNPHQVDRSEREILALLAAAGFDPLARHRMFTIMNEPQNSRSRTRHRLWRSIAGALGRTPRLGGVVGGVLYPVERALVRRPAPGPSTDLLICRRSA